MDLEQIITIISNDIKDLMKIFEELLEEILKDEEISEPFKKFIIVKMLIALKSVILIKKLYLIYHKFSL